MQIRTGSDSIFVDQDWTWTEKFHSPLISDEHGSGLKQILAGSGLDWTAIFLKIGRSGLDRTEKFFIVSM